MISEPLKCRIMSARALTPLPSILLGQLLAAGGIAMLGSTRALLYPFLESELLAGAPSFPNFFVIGNGRRPYQHLNSGHPCSRPQRKSTTFVHNEAKMNGPSSADSGGVTWCSPRHLHVLHEKHRCILSWLLVRPCSHTNRERGTGLQLGWCGLRQHCWCLATIHEVCFLVQKGEFLSCPLSRLDNRTAQMPSWSPGTSVPTKQMVFLLPMAVLQSLLHFLMSSACSRV